jgi:hypothetical protein
MIIYLFNTMMMMTTDAYVRMFVLSVDDDA